MAIPKSAPGDFQRTGSVFRAALGKTEREKEREVGGDDRYRVIAGQLHNERETKSETGSKCLGRQRPITVSVARCYVNADRNRNTRIERYRVACGIVHMPLCSLATA